MNKRLSVTTFFFFLFSFEIHVLRGEGESFEKQKKNRGKERKKKKTWASRENCEIQRRQAITSSRSSTELLMAR